MNKKIFFLTLLLGFFSLATQAQTTPTKIEYDSAGNKILMGKITENMLANDTAFRWFYIGVNHYQPNTEWLKYITFYRDSFDVIAFIGTWCPDTKRLLPAFYRVMIGSGFPINNIELYGLDEHLKGLGQEVAAYHITQTPTFIFFHNGEEIGRINDKIQRSMEEDIVSILQNAFMKKDGDTAGAGN